MAAAVDEHVFHRPAAELAPFAGELRERVSAAPGWPGRFAAIEEVLARRLLAVRYADGQRDFLAGLAADCGYYDQAHLAREFRELAGCPPSAWLAEEFRNIQAGAYDPRE